MSCYSYVFIIYLPIKNILKYLIREKELPLFSTPPTIPSNAKPHPLVKACSNL